MRTLIPCSKMPLFLCLVSLKMRLVSSMLPLRFDLTVMISPPRTSFSLEEDLILKCLLVRSSGRWQLSSTNLVSVDIINSCAKLLKLSEIAYKIIVVSLMAERLSKVYGTEMDKVNCPFFYKIGACRYGDSCERIHNKPPISETVLLEHMYENSAIETAIISGNIVNEEDAEKALTKFQTFFEKVFKQMSQFGEIEDMIVVDNLGDHIVGNVYVKYSDEEFSENALKNINGRFFNGKKISAVYSPVTDFLNAKCKQYIDGSCKRGGYCNYMHVKPLSKTFKKELFQQMYLEHPEYREKKRSDSEDSFERRKKERRERKDRKDNKEKSDKKHKKKDRDRSKSERRRSRSRDEKKRRKRSESDRSSVERRDIIDEWNKDFYK